MFLADLPPVAYSDPWNIPLSQRLKMLRAGRRRVAYFYEQANNSTFRYRAYNMVQVLNSEAADGCCGSYFFQEDLHRIEEIADAADILVICRSGYNHNISQLIAKFRIRRKRVLFDVDDLVFDIDFVPLILNTLDQDLSNPQVWHDWYSWNSRLGATLKHCDGAITTNEFLAEQIKSFSGLPVAVVPNFINREQLELSERLFAAKADLEPGGDGIIHFGYFSGSPSHNRDFALVVPAFEALLEERKDLGLVLVGYTEAGPTLSRFGSRIKYYPFQDYVNLQRIIAPVEFNLMPLQFNTFTNCKSELKYFEAAAVGTLSIASPSENYARSITDGENGYIARAHQWASVMRRAIADIERYPAMASLAHADALAKYAWFNQRDKILRALGFE